MARSWRLVDLAALRGSFHAFGSASSSSIAFSAAKSGKRHEQAKRELQELYAEWEAVAG